MCNCAKSNYSNCAGCGGTCGDKSAMSDKSSFLGGLFGSKNTVSKKDWARLETEAVDNYMSLRSLKEKKLAEGNYTDANLIDLMLGQGSAGRETRDFQDQFEVTQYNQAQTGSSGGSDGSNFWDVLSMGLGIFGMGNPALSQTPGINPGYVDPATQQYQQQKEKSNLTIWAIAMVLLVATLITVAVLMNKK